VTGSSVKYHRVDQNADFGMFPLLSIATVPCDSSNMTEVTKPVADGAQKERRVPTASAVLADGSLLEMIHNPDAGTTSFVLSNEGEWSIVPDHVIHGDRLIVPFSANNNLLTHDVVLFATHPEEYASKTRLLAAIQDFIHRYVDLTPLFERIAAHYVLLSWVHDGFHELPYLRVMGSPGSGKTRFLLTVGSLCYKPIFASGASTVSPLFRILDSMKGTLVLDEADFRFSDEKNDITKILNNGTVRGFPVLRAEQNPATKEYSPHAFHVFGPKIIASRTGFDDRGLESRFITEQLGVQRLRPDIPISLDGGHRREAQSLRNQLLLFRLRNYSAVQTPARLDRHLEPRLLQSFGPLLAVIDDDHTKTEVLALAFQYQRQIVADRGLDLDGRILEVIKDLTSASTLPPTIREIAADFAKRFGDDLERRVTPHWVGWHIRQRLGLLTQRRTDGYVIADSERTKLAALYERYGLVVGDPLESSSSTQSSSDLSSPAPPP
jgi:hypothetical protein